MHLSSHRRAPHPHIILFMLLFTMDLCEDEEHAWYLADMLTLTQWNAEDSTSRCLVNALQAKTVGSVTRKNLIIYLTAGQICRL
jgi:hypothetical protein